VLGGRQVLFIWHTFYGGHHGSPARVGGAGNLFPTAAVRAGRDQLATEGTNDCCACSLIFATRRGFVTNYVAFVIESRTKAGDLSTSESSRHLLQPAFSAGWSLFFACAFPANSSSANSPIIAAPLIIQSSPAAPRRRLRTLRANRGGFAERLGAIGGFRGRLGPI
jgi:hypothetical protein